MSTPIRFFYRGAVQEVSNVSPTQTVLQHLREDLHCTGTKEGCAEGDCGACTVVIGSLENGQLEMKAVNSCIQFTPTLDGKALFTVEDLAQGSQLHPVQQALVECHGSQCGFCTPGFAMSLWGMYLKKDEQGSSECPSRREIDDTLSGNLCRCTGYRPIIDAARRMTELPRVDFDREALANTLRGLQHEAGTVYIAQGQTFHAPRTVDELVAARAAHPQAVLLAGSTDVGLWVTKQMRELTDIIYLGHVEELKSVRQQDDMLEIGAGVTLNDAYAAICARYPELSELWQRFASLPIRNAGTLGGNVANGSPIGDSMPWLIALGASIVLRGPNGERELALEDFYLGYQQKDLQPGEFVQALRIPLPRANIAFRTYKLAKRFDQDISAVCAAFAVELDGGIVKEARIAFGGMAATPKRAALAEAALNGRAWDETAMKEAMAALAKDYAPLSDMRASNNYRMQGAQNLLRRFWLETRLDNPLPAEALNVFAQLSA
ncbi:6-hydroxypseudooxynicotine dehydrogenase complex subunit beta [Massilia sp. Bi118]|uniref:xanthine dehydrogenase small subunit n=1 Tax=Massilia sp. Bi118 TaxID=2822346 RepID=UPI001DE1E248|nr:xanthine dehydrogenase small subunit [Massilia sp. Bi118]CAH0162845.1 6-hydroxypseudooxynicotine dehydrogenase complex subunit beta [Massilia sp. Bi118]